MNVGLLYFSHTHISEGVCRIIMKNMNLLFVSYTNSKKLYNDISFIIVQIFVFPVMIECALTVSLKYSSHIQLI